MPLYEYKCDKCGEEFEVMQKFSDTPLATHDKCGGPVHRLLSAPALQFKGSGFYITDYAKSGGKGSNGSAATDAPAKTKDSGSGDKSSSGSSEAKSAPSETKPKAT